MNTNNTQLNIMLSFKSPIISSFFLVFRLGSLFDQQVNEKKKSRLKSLDQ